MSHREIRCDHVFKNARIYPQQEPKVARVSTHFYYRDIFALILKSCVMPDMLLGRNFFVV